MNDAVNPSSQADASVRSPLWLRQFEADLDFCPNSPKIMFMVCSTPRSGSHYFCHFLQSTGVFGYPLEYLNPANFRRWMERFGCQDPRETYHQIKTHRTSTNGVFGVKVHYSHLAGLHVVEDKAYEYRPIQLLRRDKLGQAVSYERAAQTKAWISEMEPVGEAVYDWESVYRKLLSILGDEAGWRAYFLSLNLNPLVIHYEDFLADPSAVVDQCCTYLNVTPLDQQPKAAFLPSRQADGVNAEWLKRFLAEAGAKLKDSLREAEARKGRPGKAEAGGLLAKLTAALRVGR
jgi:LPS sulfotransferase NodH